MWGRGLTRPRWPCSLKAPVVWPRASRSTRPRKRPRWWIHFDQRDPRRQPRIAPRARRLPAGVAAGSGVTQGVSRNRTRRRVGSTFATPLLPVTALFHSSISRPVLIPISRMGHCGARSWAERPFLVGEGAAEPDSHDSTTGASSAAAAPIRGGSRDRKDSRRFNLPARTLAFGDAGSQPRHLATVPRGRGLVHDVGRSGEVPVSPALSSA